MAEATTNGQPVRKLTTISNSGANAVAAENIADYRVAVFGAGGVGKTSLILRFIKGTFSDLYVPTIEDKFEQVNSSLIRVKSNSISLSRSSVVIKRTCVPFK
jgi:GTPase SAR1 family protein